MIRRVTLVTSAVVLAAALAFFAARRAPVAEDTPVAAVAKKGEKPEIQRQEPPKLPPASKAEILAEFASLGSAVDGGRRLALVEKLAAKGPGAEKVLAEALRDARSELERGVLSDALARIGTSEAVDELFNIINATTDATARAQLVQAFNALPSGQAIETLASSLTMKLDPQVRDGVVATVARAADASTVTFLQELYREPEVVAGQTVNVLAALGSIYNPAAATELANLLRTSGEVPIMQNAAAALGKIGNSNALQAIADQLGILGATNPELRQFMLSVVQSVSSVEALDWLQKTASGTTTDPALAEAAKTALASLKTTAP